MTKTYQEQERKIKVLTQVSCDKCSRDMVTYRGPDEQIYSSEGSALEMNFGYGSRFDGDQWNYDLCDDCCEELVRWIKS